MFIREEWGCLAGDSGHREPQGLLVLLHALRCEASLGLQRARRETTSRDRRPLRHVRGTLRTPLLSVRPAHGLHVAGRQAGVIGETALEHGRAGGWMEGGREDRV